MGLQPVAIPALLAEGNNKPGLGYAIAQAIAGAGIGIAFLTAQVIARKFAAVIGFETEDDATNALRAIRKLDRSARA